jgi:hypothetical protein
MWRFVSIVGPGGVGKTTVAISVAYTLVDGFHDAVFFVDLAAPIPNSCRQWSRRHSGSWCKRKTRSLVCWPLLATGRSSLCSTVAPALAERLVGQAPQAHILATSREALRVEGEHVHLLYSLDCPPEDAALTATEALRYPAVQLFMERAAASGYGIVLSDIDAPVVARICGRLDGIALAIELAASRVDSLAAWDPGQYALSDVHRNSHDEAVLPKCWSSRQTCCHESSWADWEPSRICGRNRLSCQRCIRAHDGRIAGRRWRLDRRLTGTIRGCEVVSCSPISHEREVVTHVVESLMNKQIAAEIAISEITVR